MRQPPYWIAMVIVLGAASCAFLKKAAKQEPTEDAAAADLDVDREAGETASLPRQDAGFVDYYQSLHRDLGKSGGTFEPYFYYDVLNIPPSDRGETTLDVQDVTLTAIPHRIVENPASTGALTVTFWKDPKGRYFFRIAGGCVAFRDRLFGPFKPSEKGFVFAGSKPGTDPTG